ncbi:hypothetical protein Hanom_Chr12g01167111 [Helianthus anomalus]
MGTEDDDVTNAETEAVGFTSGDRQENEDEVILEEEVIGTNDTVSENNVVEQGNVNNVKEIFNNHLVEGIQCRNKKKKRGRFARKKSKGDKSASSLDQERPKKGPGMVKTRSIWIALYLS